MTDVEFKELKDKVDEIHTQVTRLTTIMNGGPGHWPSCIEHSKVQDDHEKRIRQIEVKLWLAIGGAVIIAEIANRVLNKLI